MTASNRLLVATGIFHPEAGGPATYLYRLLPQLQQHGWDIRVLTYGDAPVDGYPYEVQRIPRVFLPLRLWHYNRAVRPLLRWSDLVYAHMVDLPLWGDRHAPRVLKVVGDQAWERAVRSGWVSPTTDIDRFQVQRYSVQAEFFKRNRARQVRAMDGVIVPSEYLRRMVIGWGVAPEKVKVIYNALPPELERPTQTQTEARTELNLPQDAPLLLTVARLTAWKGVDHLITALKQVKDVHLLVAGDGPERPRLEQLAASLQGRVHFLGRVPHERILLYMRAADYVALYSGYEGLSHTLLESLYVGTPVIASDKGGNPEVVQHEVNGLLVPYVDVAALTTTLQGAFSGDTRQKLAANTHHGMERFYFERMIEATAMHLASFLA
ncbi:MAG: glycosyltransferase family 4 protein [Chloroflexi bacterium]|nr:MAG: glycosyltransferase family 4 protein [Chloroflexota bacterium]